MEPLSIIGGIVAIAEAAGAVAKCADGLYRISYKAGVLAEDVELFASHVHVFGSTIFNAHRTIRDHYLNDMTSTTIQKLHKSFALDLLTFQCDCVTKRVSSLQERVNDHNGPLGLWMRVLWLLDKEKRNDIYLSMERIKLSFLLIMSQVMYEILEQRALSPSPLERQLCDFRREMKECRKQIRSHMKIMHVCKIRQERLNYHDSLRYDEGHDAAIDNIENVLLDIGSVMVDRASKRASRRTDIISTTTGRRSSDKVVDHGGGSNFSPASGTSHLTTRQSPLQEPSGESLRLTSNQPIAIHPRDAQRHGHSPPTAESSSSSLGSSSIRIQDDPQPDRALHLDEGDYIAVQASSRLLYLDPDLDYPVTQGYINSNIEPTNANLNPEFPQNVISERYATELGLAIEYSQRDNEDRTDAEAGDKDIEMEIDFGNGEVHSVIGRTSFLWKNSQQVSHLRPLRVTLSSERIHVVPDPVGFWGAVP
ncbi:uncharacterized protein BP5553_04618 [Venustampulla echinocandica]|uniref:Fungal N-terminal domain-containing protein n=1 Tax=Venustampulla echinocandica TaxID=2656787 RepID=A0A370TNS9_9HELO|nr:uncharacterized protein BP5553_04618 [Venustampulla echinocandica]RDL37185.1 hypothetical protein BP5553_04618 [Venustampulla echinocandica]